MAVACFALTCGVLVANNFYAQATADRIVAELGGGATAAALATGAVPFGFFVGLALILPAADILPPGRLIRAMLAGGILAALAAALAPGLGGFLAAAVGLGVASICGRILLPLAGQNALPGRRGRVIGQIMVGILLGTMVSRPLAALVADRLSWRAVWLGAALVMALCLLLLCPHLAGIPARRPGRYRAALVSTASLWRGLPTLRRRALIQAFFFFTLNLFWVGLPQLLADRLGIGIEGLWLLSAAPLLGVAAAMAGGRLADGGRVEGATLGCLAVLTTTLAALSLGGAPGFIALFLAAGVIDACVQLNQVLGQKVVFELDARAGARLNSAYMSVIYLAGASGSALGLIAQDRLGWGGTLALMAGVGLLLSAVQVIRCATTRA